MTLQMYMQAKHIHIVINYKNSNRFYCCAPVYCFASNRHLRETPWAEVMDLKAKSVCLGGLFRPQARGSVHF